MKANGEKAAPTTGAGTVKLDQTTVITKPEEFVNRGLAAIKPELADEWKALVKMHADDKFDRVILSGAVWVMEGLKDGETPKVADAKMDGKNSLSGSMATIVTQHAVKFSPRGEEYRKWYNGQFGAKDVEGVINPTMIGLRK